MNYSDVTELFLNYGLIIFVAVSIIVTGVVCYKLGYLFGQQDGWQQGLYRGKNFERWKHLERERNNYKNRL